MGAMCSPLRLKTCFTPSALSMRTRSCAPVAVPMRLGRGPAEARQVRGQLRQRRKLLLGVELLRPLQQVSLGLGDVRVGDAAVHRTDRRAGLLVVEADALGAEQ